MDSGSPYPWLKDMTWEDRGILLPHLLSACAKYIESGNVKNADIGLARISHLSSPDGDPMQRVATYFSEALSYHVFNRMFRGAHDILSKPYSTPEKLLVKKLFLDLYPFSRIAYATTNQTIIESMRGVNCIQILDLSFSHDATQWVLLMQSLKENYSATTPYLKISCVHSNKEMLDQIGLHLSSEAKKLKFPFEFHPIVSTLENLDLDKLPIQKGEPLAISIVLQLHSLLAFDDPIPVVNPHAPSSSMTTRTFEEVLGKNQMSVITSPDSSLSPPSLCPSPKMECFLHGLWRLQPKVIVLTEQESNVNVSTLTERVDKALHFYASLFDCLESTISKTVVERVLLERMLLGEQIRNIVACEGNQRKERHEKLKTWIPRLELAGFSGVPISSDGMFYATKQLQSYGQGYKILRENKCLFMCWNDNPLFSVSAWMPMGLNR